MARGCGALPASAVRTLSPRGAPASAIILATGKAAPCSPQGHALRQGPLISGGAACGAPALCSGTVCHDNSASALPSTGSFQGPPEQRSPPRPGRLDQRQGRTSPLSSSVPALPTSPKHLSQPCRSPGHFPPNQAPHSPDRLLRFDSFVGLVGRTQGHTVPHAPASFCTSETIPAGESGAQSSQCISPKSTQFQGPLPPCQAPTGTWELAPQEFGLSQPLPTSN